MQESNKSIGIALSGGGARGSAHIGVLAALNELGVFPSHVSGSSAGAFIGSLYCAGYTPKEIYGETQRPSFNKIFRVRRINKGLTELSALHKFLSERIPNATVDGLKLPFFIGVTNIDTGTFELLDKGPLIPSVMASCAIPIVFKPVELNKHRYVDGGLTNNLPIEPLFEKCGKVIGVGICPHNYQRKVKGMTDVGMRSFQLAVWSTMEARMKQCSLAIDVEGLSDFKIFDFAKAKPLYELGYNAVMKQAGEVEKLLGDM